MQLRLKDFGALKRDLDSKYQTLSGRYMRRMGVREGRGVRMNEKELYKGTFLCPPGHFLYRQQACGGWGVWLASRVWLVGRSVVGGWGCGWRVGVWLVGRGGR